MVKKITRDPMFLAQKSVDATEADKQVDRATNKFPEILFRRKKRMRMDSPNKMPFAIFRAV